MMYTAFSWYLCLSRVWLAPAPRPPRMGFGLMLAGPSAPRPSTKATVGVTRQGQPAPNQARARFEPDNADLSQNGYGPAQPSPPHEGSVQEGCLVHQLRCLSSHRGSFAPDRLHQRQAPSAHAVPCHPYGRAPDDQVLGAGLAPPAKRASSPHADGPFVDVLHSAPADLLLRRSALVFAGPRSEFAPAVGAGPAERAVLKVVACHGPHGCAEEPLRLCWNAGGFLCYL